MEANSSGKQIFFADEKNDIYNINQVGRIQVDFEIDNLEASLPLMMEWTMKVEKRCPFANLVFNIAGAGEGIVWKMEHPHGKDTRCWVKTKGPLHAEVDEQKLAALKDAGPVNEYSIARAAQFAKVFATEARMQKVYMTSKQMCQGKRVFGNAEKGNFMQNLSKDVEKEEASLIRAEKVNVVLLKKEVEALGKKWLEVKINSSS